MTLHCRPPSLLFSSGLLCWTPNPSDFWWELKAHGQPGHTRAYWQLMAYLESCLCAGKMCALPPGFMICHGTSFLWWINNSSGLESPPPQGVSQEGGACFIFFLAVTANHREKEGTEGPHLPGQLNAEVCRMPSINLHMLSAGMACSHGMSVWELCPWLLTKASHRRPWSSVSWVFLAV